MLNLPMRGQKSGGNRQIRMTPRLNAIKLSSRHCLQAEKVPSLLNDAMIYSKRLGLHWKDL